MKQLGHIDRRCYFSADRAHRYTLWRQWGNTTLRDLFSLRELPDSPADSQAPFVMFVGLNPSTADETNDDPTIRRCIEFTRRWGYEEFVMTNLFAFRATDPKIMMKSVDPIGPDNDSWLCRLGDRAEMIIAAWGNKGSFMGRASTVLKMLPNVQYLRLNKDGSPEHPLYIPGDTKPSLYVSP